MGESQLKQLLREIERQNPVIIPALLNPEPLLSKEVPVVIVPGGPSQAREILIYTWKYFEILPGARRFLQDFLSLGSQNPKYNTKFKTPVFWEDTTGYDRTYVCNFPLPLSSCVGVSRPKEFKK